MPSKKGKKKLLIGVTGGIGSGKSLACEYFKKLGCKIFYADDIAKEMYRSNIKLKKELVKHFGKRILDTYGNISFPKFRKIVFSSDRIQVRVNKIVHPFVIAEILRRAKDYPGKLVAIEAALIFESGFNKYLDYTILVSSTAKNRIERVRERNKLSVKDIKSIIKLQMPEKEKIKKADFILKNDSTRQSLLNKVKFLFSILNNLS
jgi:dephospho-CoA kinase